MSAGECLVRLPTPCLANAMQQLMDAVYRSDIEGIRAWLCEHVPIADGATEVYALRIVAERGHLAVLRAFLDGGVSANVRDTDRSTPLVWSAPSETTGIARELIRRGADTELADEYGWTPLLHAAAHQNLDLTRLLLESGANVWHRDRQNRTASEVARLRFVSKRIPLLGYFGGRLPTIGATDVRRCLVAHEALSRVR